MEDSFAQTVIAVFMLLFIASVSAIFLKKLRFPYTIGLVLIGIIIGFLAQKYDSLAPLKNIQLTHNLIMYILLPTLIFEAAFNIDSRLLVKNLTPVMILATPGLIISTLIVGGIVYKVTPLDLPRAMLFGALISATDPVAVISLFKEIGAPKRLTMLVDGESLFNDATAIVAFKVVFKIFCTGAVVSWVTLLHGVTDFVSIFMGGLIIGIIVGYLIIRITSLAKNDPLIQVALSSVAAYIAFIIADHNLKYSGVMSALGAGIVLSWYGVTKFTPRVKEYMQQFWEYASFAANSFIFLLLGFSEEFLIRDVTQVEGLVLHVFYGILAVIFARLVVVYGLIPIINRLPRQQKTDLRYQTILFWGGLRGAVPLALAFSLSNDFPQRQLLIEMTLGVVLFTLLVQGTTISFLLKLFKLDKPTLFEQVAKIQSLLHAMHRAGNRIKELKDQGDFSKKAIHQYFQEHVEKVKQVQKELSELKKSPDYEDDTMKRILWMEGALICQRTYLHLFEDNLISESVLRELHLHVAMEQDRIHAGVTPKLLCYVLPLERRVTAFVLNLIAKILPESKLNQSLRLQILEAKYELFIAQFIGSRHVIRLIGEMKDGTIKPEIRKSCKEFYQSRERECRAKIDFYIKESPELLRIIELHTLEKIAKYTEDKAIKDIEQNGGLTESIAESAEHERGIES